MRLAIVPPIIAILSSSQTNEMSLTSAYVGTSLLRNGRQKTKSESTYAQALDEDILKV